MIEIKILKDLRKHFDEEAPFVVLWDCFDFRNHVCMVFEPLGTSIYDFVSENGYQPFPAEMVREMAQQLGATFTAFFCSLFCDFLWPHL